MPTDLRTRDAAVAAEILRWPADADRRDELRRLGHPRLLLLGAGTAPPPRDDHDLEDWVWTPTDERDLFARLNRLTVRARPRALAPGDAVLDPTGVLVRGRRRAVLPPTEAAIFAVLAEAPGQLRSRAVLEEAVWAGRAHGRRALDSRMFTLRARIEPLGLEIHSVRGRGFTLGSTTTRTPEEHP